VSRSEYGIGASLYVFERWSLSLLRMVKTPIGVACPGRPVETVVVPIETPLRYTRASCSGTLTIRTMGPSGAASASQTNWPALSVLGSVPIGCDTLAPQKGTVSAEQMDDKSAATASAESSRRRGMEEAP
jgi:hypothetical protein